MAITYRTMRPDDYDQLVRMWSTTPHMGYSESDSREHIQAYLERNPTTSFVALDGSRVIGTILAGEDARRGFVNHLAVEPAYRGRGIGSRLATLSEEALAKLHPTKAYAFVKYDNNEALRFWRRRGYYVCDDFCVMRKSLSSEPYSVYQELTPQTIPAYLEQTGRVSQGSHVAATEFGDGNMNWIYRVEVDGKSFILKQAMPHGKIDTTVFEPVDRAHYEDGYVKYYAPYMPSEIERQLWHDDIMAINAYEDLSDMTNLRESLLAGVMYDHTPGFIGRYLAHEYYYSSVLSMPIQGKKQLEPTFSNIRMRQLTEDYLLIEPFIDCADNNVTDDVRPFVELVWQNDEIRAATRLLTLQFVSSKECLISGDFHAGNIFVSPERDLCFDFDFASWGPIAYDFGSIVGSFVLSYLTQPYINPGNERIRSQIVEGIKQIAQAFRDEVRHLLGAKDGQSANALQSEADGRDKKCGRTSRALEATLQRIESDAIGYAACNLAGRTWGYAQFKEITGLHDQQARVDATKAACNCVVAMLTRIHGVDELTEFLRDEI